MTTGRDIELPSVSRPTSGSQGRKVIAAIGIDRYDHWQRLANAVRDATRTTELFGKLGFEQITEPLLDRHATGTAIRSLVSSDLRKLGPDDSLVLFYAGHGATYGHRPGGEEIKTGYLIPTDASISPDDVSTWIDLEGWLRAVALLPAKHILVILDACRSGIALDGILQRHRGDESWQHEASAALQARRSRRIITSALGDQVALDSGPKHGHSLFTGCLIEGLTYDLRRHGDRATTGSGLGTYLQRRVDKHTNSRQTPDFGYFYHDERGEIAIPLVSDALEATPAESASTGSPSTAPFEPKREPVPPPRSHQHKHPTPILRRLASLLTYPAAAAWSRRPAQSASSDSTRDRAHELIAPTTAELPTLSGASSTRCRWSCKN